MAENTPQPDEILVLVDRFVDLANDMKTEGIDQNQVNNALMIASGVYATYLAAGNEGYLKESGILKITEAYQLQLKRLQTFKQQQHNPDGKN